MTTKAITLPPDLAPALRERFLALLQDVSPLTAVPGLDPALRQPPTFHRCIVCYESGRLGGHHGEDGHIEWIHRSCHRKLHRRGQPRRRSARQRLHAAARYTPLVRPTR